MAPNGRIDAAGWSRLPVTEWHDTPKAVHRWTLVDHDLLDQLTK